MLKAKERIRLHCYTDGGCNKKGEGAAATMLLKNADILTVSKIVQTSTTNNKMELSAAIAGLVLFKEFCEENTKFKYSLTLFTDSEYVQKGITEWIHNWKRNNWRNTSGEVKNQEYWKALDSLVQQLEEDGQHVEFKWVRGHNGNPGNTVVDRIASTDIHCSISNVAPLITSLFPGKFTNLDDEDIYVHSTESILTYV